MKVIKETFHKVFITKGKHLEIDSWAPWCRYVPPVFGYGTQKQLYIAARTNIYEYNEHFKLLA